MILYPVSTAGAAGSISLFRSASAAVSQYQTPVNLAQMQKRRKEMGTSTRYPDHI